MSVKFDLRVKHKPLGQWFKNTFKGEPANKILSLLNGPVVVKQIHGTQTRFRGTILSRARLFILYRTLPRAVAPNHWGFIDLVFLCHFFTLQLSAKTKEQNLTVAFDFVIYIQTNMFAMLWLSSYNGSLTNTSMF